MCLMIIHGLILCNQLQVIIYVQGVHKEEVHFSQFNIFHKWSSLIFVSNQGRMGKIGYLLACQSFFRVLALPMSSSNRTIIRNKEPGSCCLMYCFM